MKGEREQSVRTEPFFLTLKPAVVIGGELYFGFDVTRQFLKRAVAEGADQRPPSNNVRDTWIRNMEILRGYVGTQDSLEDIKRRYGICRERARQILVRTIRMLWSNSSPETQRLFPINQIPRKEPIAWKKRQKDHYRL